MNTHSWYDYAYNPSKKLHLRISYSDLKAFFRVTVKFKKEKERDQNTRKVKKISKLNQTTKNMCEFSEQISFKNKTNKQQQQQTNTPSKNNNYNNNNDDNNKIYNIRRW